MNWRDVRVLLSLVIAVCAFVAYELAGQSLPGWHTVSFIAQHHSALAIAIGVAFPLAGLGALGWWIHHMRQRIAR